jgi:hypothetical protein
LRGRNKTLVFSLLMSSYLTMSIFYDVNVRCLDGNAMPLFAIVPFDGKHWEENIQQIT